MRESELRKNLIARFGNPIKLKEISKEYFNLSPKVANERAFKQLLPVPVAKLVDSKTAPYIIDAGELAKYIESRIRRGQDEWRSVNK